MPVPCSWYIDSGNVTSRVTPLSSPQYRACHAKAGDEFGTPGLRLSDEPPSLRGAQIDWQAAGLD